MDEKCEACGGCGVLFGSGKQVERCDMCERFDTDEAALADVERVYQEAQR